MKSTKNTSKPIIKPGTAECMVLGPIENKISKQTFISEAKNFIKSHVDQILQGYRDHGTLNSDEDILKQIDKFFNLETLDISTYQTLEANLLNIQKKRLNTTKSNRMIYWRPLIGAVYYLLGICTLAQSKKTLAEIYFKLSSATSFNTEIELISYGSIAYSNLLGVVNLNDFFQGNYNQTTFKINLEKNAISNINPKLLTDWQIEFRNHLESNNVTNDELIGRNEKVTNIRKLFSTWKEEKGLKKTDEKKLKIIQSKLIQQSDLIKYIMENNDDLEIFFKCAILDKLVEIPSATNTKENVLKNYYQQVIGYFIVAKNERLSFEKLVYNIINGINSKNDKNLLFQLKNILELLIQQIKNDDLLFCLFNGEKDINCALSRIFIEQKKNTQFNLAIQNNKFIEECKTLVNKDLSNLCSEIKTTDLQNLCNKYVNQLLNIIPTNYQELHDNCKSLMSSLYEQYNSYKDIESMYGPALDVLSYIVSICNIALAKTDIEIKTSDLDDAIYGSSLPIKNHLLILQAFIYAKRRWIYGALYDLDQISDNSSCSTLKEKINNPIKKYLKKYPILNCKENEKINILLKELENAMIANNYLEVFKKQEEFENYLEHERHPFQEVQYNLIMNICYFKLRKLSTPVNYSSTNQALLSHFQDVLEETPAKVEKLFQVFEQVLNIYGENTDAINSIPNDCQQLIDDGSQKEFISSFKFENYVKSYDARAKIRVNETENLSNLVNSEIKTTENIIDINSCNTSMEPISYQSIEENLKKFDLIKQNKEYVKSSLEDLKNIFIEEDVIKIISDFLNIGSINDIDIAQYKNIEDSAHLILNQLMDRSRRYDSINSSHYWFPMIGTMYYILATSQFAQNKLIQAQFNYIEGYSYIRDMCYKYSIAPSAENPIINNNKINLLASGNILSTYAALVGNPTTTDLIKGKWFHFMSDKFRNVISKNEGITNIFNLIYRKIAIDLDLNADDQKEIKIEATRKCFEAWEAKPDETLEAELINNILYLNEDNYVKLFSFIIKRKITYYASLNKECDQIIKLEYKKDVINSILEANKYIPFNMVITKITIDLCAQGNKEYSQLCEVDNILEELQKKLKIDNLLNSTLCENKNIKSLIYNFSSESRRAPFNLNYLNKVFVEESKSIASPVLNILLLDVKIMKVECSELIQTFMDATENEDYQCVYNKCNELKAKLVAEHSFLACINHTPVLNILDYIAGMCKIASTSDMIFICKAKSANENNASPPGKYFNEILYKPHNSKIKNLALLSRAFVLLKNNSVTYAVNDLDLIESSSCRNLKDKIYRQLNGYIGDNPTIRHKKDKTIDKLLDDLKSAVSNQNHQDVYRLRGQYEQHDPNKMHHSYETMYHFWMTIHYFILRDQTNDHLNKYNEFISVYLKTALMSSSNVTQILFHFVDIISGFYPNAKPYIELFYKDYCTILSQSIKIKEHCDCELFHKYMTEYLKEITNKEEGRAAIESITFKKINIEKKAENIIAHDLQKSIIAIAPKKHNPKPTKNFQAKLKKEKKKNLKKENEIKLFIEKINTIQRKIDLTKQSIAAITFEGDNHHAIIKLNITQEKLNQIKNNIDYTKDMSLDKSEVDNLLSEVIQIIDTSMQNYETIIEIADQSVNLKNTLTNKLNTVEKEINETIKAIDETKIKIENDKKVMSLKDAEICEEDEHTYKELERLINEMDDKLCEIIESTHKEFEEVEQFQNKKEAEYQKNIDAIASLKEDMDIIDQLIKIENIEKRITDTETKIRYEKDNAEKNITRKIDKLRKDIEKKYNKIAALETQLALKEADIVEIESEIAKKREKNNLEREDLASNRHLYTYFKKDMKELHYLNKLATGIGRSVNFKGSFVFDWCERRKADIKSFELANKKLLKDIDAYIDCIGIDDYKVLLESLISNGYIVMGEGNTFVNLNKTLNNGLILDLTLKTGTATTSDPMNITGEIRLDFLKIQVTDPKFPNGKYLPTLRIIDKEKFAIVEQIYQSGKAEIGMPSMNTTNYAWRLYKLNSYEGIIKITNLAKARKNLYEHYVNSLTQHRSTIYFELVDFIKHDGVDYQLHFDDKHAVKLLRLIFNVFFDHQLKIAVDVNEFVKFFISCKDEFYTQNKVVFKEQIDLMLALYSKKYDLNTMKNEIRNLKSLYLQSIGPKDKVNYTEFKKLINVCNPELVHQNKKIFEKQIDILVSLYLENCDVNIIKAQVKKANPLSRKTKKPNVHQQRIPSQSRTQTNEIIKISSEFRERTLIAASDYKQKILQASGMQTIDTAPIIEGQYPQYLSSVIPEEYQYPQYPPSIINPSFVSQPSFVIPNLPVYPTYQNDDVPVQISVLNTNPPQAPLQQGQEDQTEMRSGERFTDNPHILHQPAPRPIAPRKQNRATVVNNTSIDSNPNTDTKKPLSKSRSTGLSNN